MIEIKTHSATLPIKWAGSKRKLALQILSHVPTNAPLYDLFCGSAALSQWFKGPCFCSDTNAGLIEALIYIQTTAYDEFMGDAKAYISRYQTTAELHDYLRQLPKPTGLEFLLLNKTSFNGLYRTNAQGLNNVSWNQVQHLRLPAQSAWDSVAFSKTNFTVGCWSEYQDLKDVTIYLDPPYLSNSVQYGHEAFDHVPLLEAIRNWQERGNCIILSHNDTQEARMFYGQVFSQPLVLEHRYSASGKSTARRKVRELLFIHKNTGE